jgi:perosamine synthetase
MKKLPKNLEWRRHIQARYNAELVDNVGRPSHSETVQYYCARVSPNLRNDLINYLADKRIHTSVHFKPLHLYSIVKQNREYPVADKEWLKLISLPCHPGMTEEDISYVVYWVNKFFETESLK